jgi:hypothetical protein
MLQWICGDWVARCGGEGLTTEIDVPRDVRVKIVDCENEYEWIDRDSNSIARLDCVL